MFDFLFKRFAGRHYRKFLESAKPVVAKINEIEESYQSLSEEQLKAKTVEFRERVKGGESLDDILPEAFAAVKNAARRLVGTTAIVNEHEQTWDMVHFDVQLIGGLALHHGKIAEMATGEGKTLVATLPLYLNALTSRNSQLVTVNDYLARRDSEWMGHLYQYLGLTVGCIQQQMPSSLRREMYGRDITYGTASEFGFDYLRDNGMATRKEDQVQRDHWFCIVDEIDSILVDEARTPLIISGPAPIEREQPFTRLKPTLERLVNMQLKLCNRLISEAKPVVENESASSDERAEAFRKLLQVKLGHPKNKLLLRVLEVPAARKELDKLETEMNSDLQKAEMYALKEELFFTIDERQHQSDLTEIGRNTLRPDNPDAFVLPDLAVEHMEIDRDESLTPEQREEKKNASHQAYAAVSEEIHAISQLLRAYCLYERDVEYVVQEGKVNIVDENTGRVMPGRRWSDGLHQAVEAKEGVTIERETRTYATVTIQNYFRMYEKLAGMTGTAETEAAEFSEIYGLGVQVIPTNKPNIREDKNDSIFKTRRDKFNAVVAEITEANKRGQPVLVGTVSVESSEVLSRMLKRANIIHTVLNAKFHEQEADIVARAGHRGGVTIATNMAGRGTDIKLGEGVRELGGLYVIGTERHESRRIDRQLRGRCSRQGDPGTTKFFLSLEDNLMRLFLQGNLASRLMEGSMRDGEELEHSLLNRSIESAQKKVEQQNFSQRKRLLQYDDVLNQQREVIYGIRNAAIHADRPKTLIFEQVEEEVVVRLETAGFDEKGGADAASIDHLVGWFNTHFPIGLHADDLQGKNFDTLTKELAARVHKAYEVKESVEVPEALGGLERYVVINAIDKHWQEHLTEMEELRRAIGLRSYGQKDPLVEYKGEAFKYFEELMNNVRLQICTGLFRSATNIQAFENMLQVLSRGAKAVGPENAPAAAAPGALPTAQVRTTVTGGGATGNPGAPKRDIKLPMPKPKPVQAMPKVGRNDPCPCGSGKKYKQCHGK
ncbi:preprotein translocase subunit SecA [Synoicihabitans lomoniglobus]|uniref:Protein translocase subunit SecA n=1 Tax=Synoicihabitans lomoniglobus TaxID=2909285 RepID=A0AAE9ZYX3_9BACT|nr:preprotein translocase subunit SecA [Opitutaceae bacterium LMO-M01]WED65665.1 preprotein translocase subunit SecA [Opitutaceae bacterium LMO-M01]